jgi:hypothetical protein
MRTTLTLDEELARQLKKLASSTGRSFKEVVNEAIRKGLSLGDEPDPGGRPFRVQAKACGFRPGVDPLKLNQIYDDLEVEDLGLESGYGVHEP